MASHKPQPITSLLEYSGSTRVPLVMQAEMAECGLACIAMISSYHGLKLDMASMRKRYRAAMKGMNLQQMIELADGLNLATRALKCPLEEVGKLQLPCVLHWDMNHFVVLTGVTKHRISVNDPGMGKRQLTLKEFAEHFTGIALELTPAKGFQRRDQRSQMKLSQLWSSMTGFGRALVSLTVLSVLLQLFALATPYYMQWVVDEVLISQDQPLLTVLAIGFGLLVLINVITSCSRSWLVLRVSSSLNLQMGANLLRHLLRLPMSFFEKRHVGDIVSRFGSLSEVRERLTTGVVETFVDGVMALAVLAMMLLYSIKLTVVVLVAVGLYTVLRLALYRPLQRATEESIQASAKEQTNFLENIRGIQTIKLFTRESQRQGIWQNRFADVINADIRLGKLNISFEAMNKLLFGIENVLVVFFAAALVMAGDLSVGMMLAFMAYKNMLTERLANLVEQLILFRMLRLHLDRISDIALHEQEGHRDGGHLLPQIHGHLKLERVCFRYSDDDPLVIDNLSLEVHPGESIAITGPSGCGKSTLMKLMLGLLTPTSGRVLLDGVDITHIGLIQYRKQIAAVMQDDTLLSGSVADNITFFDPEPNYPRMQQCAQLAAIEQGIARLSMHYNALVGDMGNQFSGGQIQRLLLARALYQQPSILFLDEATSHLDIDKERLISNSVAALSMTRIIIAHRRETIASCDREYSLLTPNREVDQQGGEILKEEYAIN
ncbi:peptidase domain-containing ABC transporter [Ferrimonas aestuarii]|uniref:Peptidase domain-containing ABC transporter n=1 Tax=Ferrimonas aestuarii TaxID=2569539 RepID=A0A4U1BNY7_9GAMM|nr:peptidase domain-containing ABC transporter [Ferrimonas aestuarii]TKB51809.1 peptidase domain-containing ABC transporter [Ferrimonas aestuarii]